MAPSHTPSSARPVEPDTAKAGRIIRGMLFLLDALLLAIGGYGALLFSAWAAVEGTQRDVGSLLLLTAANVGTTIAAATAAVQTFRNKNPLTSVQGVLIGSILTAALWLSVFGPPSARLLFGFGLGYWLVIGIGAAWWGLVARRDMPPPTAAPVTPESTKVGRVLRGLLFLLEALLLASTVLWTMYLKHLEAETPGDPFMERLVTASWWMAGFHVPLVTAAVTAAVQTFRNKNPLISVLVVGAGSILSGVIWVVLLGPALLQILVEPDVGSFLTWTVVGVAAAWWGLVARQRAEAPSAGDEAEASEPR